MEDQKRKQREMFSFPSTPPPQDSDFEFGSLTPESPTRSSDPYKNSPADHLFFNGKLLPHSFPAQQSGSSLMSSRSNSVNSTRSTVSARISTSSSSSSSDNSERRLIYRTRKFGSVSSSSSSFSSFSSSSSSSCLPMASKLVMGQLYGTSQRWQHIVVPLPVLKREDSKRSNHGVTGKKEKCNKELDQKKKNKSSSSSSSGFCLKFFKSLLVTCRQCHSMEPSSSDDILQVSSR